MGLCTDAGFLGVPAGTLLGSEVHKYKLSSLALLKAGYKQQEIRDWGGGLPVYRLTQPQAHLFYLISGQLSPGRKPAIPPGLGTWISGYESVCCASIRN